MHKYKLLGTTEKYYVLHLQCVFIHHEREALMQFPEIFVLSGLSLASFP